MAEKWRELDLEGGGLQAANLRLARALLRRSVAWSLMLAFPSGAHRWYLGQRRSALLFPLLTAGVVAAAHAGWTAAALVLALALGALLVHDMLTLERRLTSVNKQLRMAIYLGQGAAAPAGFRGRYSGTADAAGAETPRRMPTVAEQEALLREIARRKTQ